MEFLHDFPYPDVALVALRSVVGVIFLVHGLSKLKTWKAPSAPGGMAGVMKLLSIAEPLGAIAVILGFLTQYAAAGLAVIMLGATYMKIAVWKSGFRGKQGTGWEFDLLIIATCLILIAIGPGGWSLDREYLAWTCILVRS